MNIRRATCNDIDQINALLYQVLTVHHNGRPDLFRENAKKYTDEELKTILTDDKTPVFVAGDGQDILGYAFCIFQKPKSAILTDVKTLYIDDLCVEEKARGKHIGRQLYEFVLNFARQQNCYNVTLNVWACNKTAIQFYENCGMQPQKIGMEKIL